MVAQTAAVVVVVVAAAAAAVAAAAAAAAAHTLRFGCSFLLRRTILPLAPNDRSGSRSVAWAPS